tara:strand:- start:1192 stop:1581 length:390 start_codon:yes stop_codon:yes gene_type:complete
MPCLDGRTFRKRLLSGLQFYESQIANSGRVLHAKRRDDIQYMTRIIHTTIDDGLLEYELRRYLDNLQTGSSFFRFFYHKAVVSYLRELLLEILHDENRKYNLYVLWMTTDHKQEPMSEPSRDDRSIMPY